MKKMPMTSGMAEAFVAILDRKQSLCVGKIKFAIKITMWQAHSTWFSETTDIYVQKKKLRYNQNIYYY